MARPPEVFVRPVSMAEGRRLRRIRSLIIKTSTHTAVAMSTRGLLNSNAAIATNIHMAIYEKQKAITVRGRRLPGGCAPSRLPPRCCRRNLQSLHSPFTVGTRPSPNIETRGPIRCRLAAAGNVEYIRLMHVTRMDCRAASELSPAA